jgi:hypothetical protein
MLYQKLTTLAAVLQASLVRTATLPAEYLDARDIHAFNTSLDARDDTHDFVNPVERDMLNKQDIAYKWIFWEVAYPGANAIRGTLRDGGCTVSCHKFFSIQAAC